MLKCTANKLMIIFLPPDYVKYLSSTTTVPVVREREARPLPMY